MSRAEINLTALRHNLSIARHHTQARILAVIKANAYGHGMLQIARALDDVDAFAVATLPEAIELRESGIFQPLLVLEGFNNVEGLRLLHAYELQSVIHTEKQVSELESSRIKLDKVWLKIDTGMHRLGIVPEQAAQMLQRLQSCANVMQPVNLMTHLACADDRSSTYTRLQLQNFQTCLDTLPLSGDEEISIANSAGILAWPESHQHTQWVRPGIMLYGGAAVMQCDASQFQLRPVMTLKSEVIALRQFKQGDSIGYGQAYICERDTRVAVVAIGYGDGYPRHARNGTPVLIGGQLCPLIGRVSMDMISVDISAIPQVSPGDEVILWGEGLPADHIAEYAATISYELFCGLTRRVSLHYYHE